MSLLPDEFHFLRPLWLLLLLGLPVLALIWRRLQAARDPWSAVVDPHLLAALREPGDIRADPWPLLLAMLVTAIAALALAGPAWQREAQPLVRVESALIIGLDMSDRMRAADVPPSRLARARFKLADLLRERQDGQTALIAYAGDAFVVAPLTDDAETLQSLLAALDHDTLPERGQRADRAIRVALELLKDAGFAGGDLVLLTDRAEPRDAAAAREAAAAGLRISVLGVGTAEGAPIALRGGGFLSDQSGNMLLPALDAASLQALAQAGGGGYHRLTTGNEDLRALGVFDPPASSTELREDDAVSAQYRDAGPWLLLALLPLAALCFRRGWLLCLPLLLALPPPAQALDFEALWRRPDQRAWRALEQEQAAQARALAKDPALRGSAAYREGDFAAAAADFAVGDSADAHYNRGNALAMGGKLEEALQAYDEALRRAPGMEDALANRKAVEDALRQSPPQEQQSPSGEQGDPEQAQPQQGEGAPADAQEGEGEPQTSDAQGGEDGQPSSDDQSGSGDGVDPPQEDPAGGDQREAQEQAFADAMAEALAGQDAAQEAQVPAPSPEEIQAQEQQQAMEQLLRRVPDDPGGLLRRKFAIEHRKRQLEARGDE